MTEARKMTVPDFAGMRFHMVESQVRPNKVTDRRILDAMGALPREMFVPPAMADIAYLDEDLQVAPGRYLLEPMVLARLLQEVEICPGDRILDIAPATGYSTAILASMVGEVVAVESDATLRDQAEKNLETLRIKNTDIRFGSLVEGYPQKAPYDVIVINGGAEFLPETLTTQLAEDGRLVTVVRDYGVQPAVTGEARLYQKIRGQISHRALFDASVNPLPGFLWPRKFTF